MCTLIIRHSCLTMLHCYFQQANIYLQEINKLKAEVGLAQNEVSTLKELSLNAPKSAHLDEVLNFFSVKY
jgi:hypothetical protein